MPGKIKEVELQAVADFAVRTLPHTVGKWPRLTLLQWLKFHADQGALAVCGAAGKILGLGVGVRCDPADMDDPWTRWSKGGTCFYLYQVSAETPAALAGLMATLFENERDIMKLKIFTFRHGCRRQISNAALMRMAQGIQWET